MYERTTGNGLAVREDKFGRVRAVVPLKTVHGKGLMHVKSVETRSPLVGLAIHRWSMERMLTMDGQLVRSKSAVTFRLARNAMTQCTTTSYVPLKTLLAVGLMHVKSDMAPRPSVQEHFTPTSIAAETAPVTTPPCHILPTNQKTPFHQGPSTSGHILRS
ncbi:hypothetical protein TNCV_2361081 [Trichonephila clavipes]|nr:hypothetical protein TNCV_2361081 [Trichonephila clavipes]